MTILPIVVRELRVAARSRSLYQTRFWTAVACVAYGSYLIIVFGREFAPVGGGHFVFSSLSYLGFLYCIGLARSTVDCISQEKREGTLGLLFLTDLKGYDVVMGKLFSNSLKSFYGLLAAVPVVCCAWVMGGVTVLEMSHVVWALLNIFFFAHATGLLISTYSRDAHRATTASALVLLLYFLGIPGLVASLRYYHFLAPAEILEMCDPGNAFRQSDLTGSSIWRYWNSLLIVNLNAWAFLVLASLRLPRCWQDKPRNPNSAWRARFRQWCFGPLEVREALRLRLLDLNPFFWLVSRNRLGQATVWAGLGLLGCAFAWGVGETGLRDSMPLFVAFVVVSHGMLKCCIASEASIHLEEQRRSGALEFLLSCTPLSASEVIRGQWLALRRRFLGPLVAVIMIDLNLIIASGLPAANNDSEAETYFTVGVIAAMLMLVADSLAIGWLGMWRAMSAKKPRQAASQTIVRILVLPWLILGLLGPMGFFDSFAAALFWWFLLGGALDLGFATIAKQNLYDQLRALAAVQPSEQLGIFGRLGRALGGMAR